ncbi:MAG: class I SAM-dependent methyltransferase [Nitrosomonadaceae bacterium]|nr:class I SAM-dependent methyltransferase [Nitrosomonadaceae bacterium]
MRASRKMLRCARSGLLVLCAVATATAVSSASAQTTPASSASQAVDVDVPFIVSPPAVTQAMLDIARVNARDYLIDLGAGDGRVVILAATRYGARGLGVEIDPQLVKRAQANAKAAKVEARAEFREEDLFKTDLSPASVVTMYLLPAVNLQLRERLLALKPGTRLVSHDWDMGDWQPDEERSVAAPDKPIGKDKTSRVMLWVVPAQMAGKWCGTDDAEATLTVSQRYQKAEGKLVVGSGKQRSEIRFRVTLSGNAFVLPLPDGDIPARINGDELEFLSTRVHAGFKLRRAAEADSCALPQRLVMHSTLEGTNSQ